MRRDLLRPESRGSPPARWTTWCGPRATNRASRARRSRGSATGIDEGVHEFLARRLDRTWFPRLAGRHPPGRESGAPGGLPGAGGGHRRVGPGPPGDPGTWPWGTPRPPISGRPCFAVPARTGAQDPLPGGSHRGRAGRPVTPTPESAPPSGRSFPGPPGSAAAPRFARNITSRLGSARPRARGRPGLHDLRPDQSGGRGGPVQARRRHFEGPVPRDRPDAD